MYSKILKQGSNIANGLSSYKQPFFVYNFPNRELCGGVWVILNPSINSHQMEMYANVEARAGVLEPVGIVKIKCAVTKFCLMKQLNETYD